MTRPDMAALVAEFERLQRKSAKCWRLACDEAAPMPERDAAAFRCLELDYAAGKVASQIARIVRAATTTAN